MPYLFHILFLLLQLPFAVYLLQPPALLLLHYIKKGVYPYRSPLQKTPVVDKNFSFAAIVTAHADARFIAPIVDSLLKQDYPQVAIYVVADACGDIDFNFKDPRVHLLVPPVPLHAKTKSIQMALDSFEQEPDVVVIFDADNLVAGNYFSILNRYFQQGFRAVQTNMLSKNTATSYARLDSIGHIYYSFLERQMRMELGISAHILGLGIAIETNLYRQMMYKHGLGGFDKKLQAQLVRTVPQLAFAKEAIVYDEKVDDGATLERQRTRWLFTYFHYLGTNWKLFLHGLSNLKPGVAYFGFITLRPPMIVTLFMALVFSVAGFFLYGQYAWVWPALLLLYAIGFAGIVITQSVQKGTAHALFLAPLFALRQVKALFKMRSARTSFLKTEHTKVLYIEDVAP